MTNLVCCQGNTQVGLSIHNQATNTKSKRIVGFPGKLVIHGNYRHKLVPTQLPLETTTDIFWITQKLEHFKMVRHDKCCWVADVHAATKIIALLGLIFGTIGSLSLLILDLLQGSYRYGGHVGFLIGFVITIIFNSTLHGLLLYGSLKKKSGPHLFWLVVQMIVLLVSS